MMRRSILFLAVLLLMCSGVIFADHHEGSDGDSMMSGMIADGGVAAVPVGADGPGVALPGGAYEFVIHAHEGDTLTFATMLAQSNDGFLAPNEYGIALYDMGAPVSGDVTDQVYYWDLGTERNERIGEGMYQAPRQSAPNSGPAGDGMVRLASELDDRLSYPTAAELVSVTLTPGDMDTITVRIDNVSDMSMGYASPITPVLWIVESHGDMMIDDMADDGMMDDDEMADDDMMDDDDMADDDMMDDDDMADDDMMDDEMMKDDMMMKHGILFTTGLPDYGHGLEALAEDGDPSALAAHHGIDMGDMMMDEM
ncbi:MAG: spondin domain-containing protein [Chloroflexota bacterium]|nr:spondin domain-containing protein [Chloroflexota bacterium]MDE2945582.1 spondin domain-containing protein [Chloroflexota bacterium]